MPGSAGRWNPGSFCEISSRVIQSVLLVRDMTVNVESITAL